MCTGIIYKWTNKKNGKSYIGQTINETKRFEEHLRSKDDKPFHIALREEGGLDGFYYDVLEKDVPEEKLNEREIYWIAYYDSFKNGYNTDGGGGYYFRSEKKREYLGKKLSKSLLGHAKPLSEEGKASVVEANKRRTGIFKHSEETKHKISIKSSGANNGMYGKKHSEETKQKMAAARIGKSSWNKGKPMSEETKQKLSAARKGTHHPKSEAQAAKIRGRHRVYSQDGSYHYE